MLSKNWVIGTDATCDVVVGQPTVSSRHCRLSETPDGFLLEDLQSRNGTFVNGQRLHKPRVVLPQDTITLGRSVPMPWPAEILPQWHSDAKAAQKRAAVAMADGARQAAPTQGRREERAVVIRIGRADDNEVVLDFPMVSNHHARITIKGERAWIEDLGSTNGTAVGDPNHKIHRAPLERDVVVYFGSTRVPAARLLAGRLALGHQPYTAVKTGEKAILLGRAENCDHVLSDPRISRYHARLTRSGTAVYIEDLHSTYGTYVNGQQIKKKVVVQPGDLIGIGQFTFRIAADGHLEQRDYRGNLAIECGKWWSKPANAGYWRACRWWSIPRSLWHSWGLAGRARLR